MTTKKTSPKTSPKTKTRISGASIPSADPDDLTIVEDPAHLLYDDRVHLALQEPLVLNIMTHGVLDPVQVVRDGDDLLVCDGRQRVKNAREANRRLKAQGSLPVRVPYLCKRGTNEKILGVMASSFLRTEDSAVSRAKKMLKHVEIGRTTDEIAVDFGCSAKTVKTTLALLDCTPTVLKAVDAGLPVEAARTLAKLPRAQQAAALAEMTKMGAVKGTKAKAAADAATGKTKVTPMLPRRDILAIRLRLEAQTIRGENLSGFAAEVLRFVMGEDDAFARNHPWHAGKEAAAAPKTANGVSSGVPSLLAGSRP